MHECRAAMRAGTRGAVLSMAHAALRDARVENHATVVA
jgi:hypothetical protein